MEHIAVENKRQQDASDYVHSLQDEIRRLKEEKKDFKFNFIKSIESLGLDTDEEIMLIEEVKKLLWPTAIKVF